MTTWKTVHQRNSVLWFAFRLVTIYGLLTMPWGVLTEVYVDIAQRVVQTVFGADDAWHTIAVENLKDDPEHPYWSRIEIVNRALMNPDGSGPVRNVDFDARLMNPALLLIALVIATPVSWRRRGWALLWGVLDSCLLGMLFLGFSIWDESSEISLVTLSPVTQEAVRTARDLLTSQLGLSVPVLLWILLTFRKEDF